MPLNSGLISAGCGDDVEVRIYYDRAWLNDDPTRDPMLAPLVNGPRGYALDMTNRSGRKARFTVTGITDQPLTITMQTGDPVTSGPPNGRSRTAAQMAQLGLGTRGSVGGLQITCD